MTPSAAERRVRNSIVAAKLSANLGIGRNGRSSDAVKLSQWIGTTRLAPVFVTSVSQ